MARNYIETRAHTGKDGKLHLDLDTGMSNVEVTVIVRPAASNARSEEPRAQFDQSGTIPDRRRAFSYEIEERLPME